MAEDKDLETVHEIIRRARITDSFFDVFLLQELMIAALKVARLEGFK